MLQSLSGAVAMQVFLYYQLYPKDMLRIKIMVCPSSGRCKAGQCANYVGFQVGIIWYAPMNYEAGQFALTLMLRVIDALHSIMTMTANWQYLITRFGEWDTTDEITW